MKSVFPILIFVLLLLPARQEAAEGLPEVVGGRADTVLTNAKILTMNQSSSIQQGLAIRGGRFVAVGSDQQIRLWIGPNTRVINAGGRTVIPGLNDGHVYASLAGITWQRDVHWEFTRSLADGLKQITAAAADRPAGSWIVVEGGWTPAQFSERRFPSRAELDAVAPKQPVLVLNREQFAVLNSAGLTVAGITRKTPDPPGGGFERDANTGEPTGVVRGAPAVEFVYKKIPEPALDGAREGLRALFRELNRLGITSVVDLQNANLNFGHRRLLADMARTGELSLRMTFFVSPGESGVEELRRLSEEMKQLGGGDSFRFAGFGDNLVAGSNPAATPNASTMQDKTKEKLQAAIRFLAASGDNFQLRAVDENSTRQLLDILEEVNREKPFGNRRIGFTHVGDLSPESIERIKKLGGGISTDAASALMMGSDAETQAVRKISSAPLRKIVDAHVPLGAGSDGFHSGNYSPMLSLWSLVTGKSVGGLQLRDPTENVSREEALRMYTMGSAWFTVDDWRKGSIETGKFADFAILSEDYLAIPEDRIPALESLLTVVGGRVVYAAGPFTKYAK
ncbi:MAG TPA: amidohydrolase [Candidatus Binatia bacterium]|jgi:hypothetical protein